MPSERCWLLTGTEPRVRHAGAQQCKHCEDSTRALCSYNHRLQLVDQAMPLDRLLGNTAAWLIEVGSLGLGHSAFALGKEPFLELFDRALHLAQLPGGSG
jgi:hypothetical protein